MSLKDQAVAVHRSMTAEEHTARARELHEDAKTEREGGDIQVALALYKAASMHIKYAENPNWRDQ